MDVVKAREFIQHLYDTHIPDPRWGDCTGDHDVSGYEYELPSWRYWKQGDILDQRCLFHLEAADILGLPVATWTAPPPREPSPEPALLVPKFLENELLRQAEWTKNFLEQVEKFQPGSTVRFTIKGD